VEHVIGFHQVRLLRPLKLSPTELGGEIAERWGVMSVAIGSALDELGKQRKAASVEDKKKFASLPALTVDVLVHTWDLARALGVIAGLNTKLCASALTYMNQYIVSFQASGLFESARPVKYDASKQTRLVALLGRDPSWGFAQDTRR
jgi:hypothetical protein